MQSSATFGKLKRIMATPNKGVELTEQATEAPARVWMDYTEAAEYCGLHSTTLWRAVKRRELRAGGVGRAVRFHRDDLDEFMRSGSNASRR